MKKISLSLLFLFFVSAIFAQPIFELGIKGGINNSKITANIHDYNSESIVKSHIGAFARLGVGNVYVQPEVYFSSKGGELKSSVLETATQFDLNNVDVPVLLGVRIINGETANVHLIAGPIFSFVTSTNIYGDTRFTEQYFRDHYFGYQYGFGVDLWKFFVDARIEHSTNYLYYHPDLLKSKNKSLMITVGFKIL